MVCDVWRLARLLWLIIFTVIGIIAAVLAGAAQVHVNVSFWCQWGLMLQSCI